MRPDLENTINVETLRRDFPILERRIHGKPLVYLDNAATTLKPRPVIEALSAHYLLGASNVHRGVHTLSVEATDAFEAAREKVRSFVNARDKEEILFTRGTTESINLVAGSFAALIKPGDEILISHMEHHSNIVPWQMLGERTGCVLRVIPITDDGALDEEAFGKLLTERVKLLSLVHVSNSLGTVNPVRNWIRKAHALGIPVLIDGAQSVSHMPVDVTDLDCDFFAFSGHKMYGPTGIGVLYGKREWLEKLPPVQGGGDMIASVTFAKTTYNVLPHRFEAGTPHIAGVIGLGASVDYLEAIGMEQIARHEHSLLIAATAALEQIPGLKIIGTAPEKGAIISFVLGDVHPHDIGTLVDQEGVAIRTGHHCTQPVMDRFGIPATARASFGLANVPEDITRLTDALQKVIEVFR